MMPAITIEPPAAVASVSGSLRNSAARIAATTGWMSSVSEENVAGSQAIENATRPCPPACTIQPSASTTAHPAIIAGTNFGSNTSATGRMQTAAATVLHNITTAV